MHYVITAGGNAPNVFYDPKSSESALPPFSTGERDDVFQKRALGVAQTASLKRCRMSWRFWTRAGRREAKMHADFRACRGSRTRQTGALYRSAVWRSCAQGIWPLSRPTTWQVN